MAAIILSIEGFSRDEHGRLMSGLSAYSARERLKNGTTIEIRALRRADRDGLIAAVRGMSDRSLYRRFFGFRREFSDREVSKFLDIDFRGHVALVAVNTDQEIVGGARYVVIAPGQAEVACAVTDTYQGKGLGTILIRHLAGMAKQAGARELMADVLADNMGMLKVFQNAGYPVTTRRHSGVVQVIIQLAE
jgi:GNAT superfamily N-acetyltransferase